MSVTKSAQDPTVILFSSFGGEPATTVTAVVTGSRFTIPQQTIQGMGYSGSGTINGSILTFSYSLSLSSLINVSSSGTKM